MVIDFLVLVFVVVYLVQFFSVLPLIRSRYEEEEGSLP